VLAAVAVPTRHREAARHHEVAVTGAEPGPVLHKRHVIESIEPRDGAQVIEVYRPRIRETIRNQRLEQFLHRELGVLLPQADRDLLCPRNPAAAHGRFVMADDRNQRHGLHSGGDGYGPVGRGHRRHLSSEKSAGSSLAWGPT
jgi:hypothetical protein